MALLRTAGKREIWGLVIRIFCHSGSIEPGFSVEIIARDGSQQHLNGWEIAKLEALKLITETLEHVHEGRDWS
jgi:hypothetical protein